MECRGGGGSLADQEGVGPGGESGQGQRGLAALENGTVKPACGAGDARAALIVQHLTIGGKDLADSGGREGAKEWERIRACVLGRLGR